MITLIDSGICNLTSVTTALDRVGAAWTLGETPEHIARASALLLPGVGAFADGMESLRKRSLVEPIKAHAAQGRPILGICLGMQLLAEGSEEFGDHAGLGLIQGHVRRLPAAPGFRVPNIGWCDVQVRPGTRLLGSEAEGRSYYFVHSYFFDCADKNDIAGWLTVGLERISIALERGHIFGAQFHPEKSQDAGLGVLARFAAMVAQPGAIAPA
jgi:imidazole glycerol-phosphate synthase subunit HisH